MEQRKTDCQKKRKFKLGSQMEKKVTGKEKEMYNIRLNG